MDFTSVSLVVVVVVVVFPPPEVGHDGIELAGVGYLQRFSVILCIGLFLPFEGQWFAL